MLRTTQWTRASSIRRASDGSETMFDSVPSGADDTIGHVRCQLAGVGRDSYSCMWSSFEEQTVDALATGAEEGRSNLR
jgi:hypothetical protein